MKNKKFDTLLENYLKLKSKEEQMAFLKDFMLSSSFEELKAWNDYIGEKMKKFLKEKVAAGLSDEDKEWFRQQYARFDDIAVLLKNRAYTRKAA